MPCIRQSFAKCPLPVLAELHLWECNGGKDLTAPGHLKGAAGICVFHSWKREKKENTYKFSCKKKFEEIITDIFLINLEYEYYYYIWMNNSLFDYY